MKKVLGLFLLGCALAVHASERSRSSSFASQEFGQAASVSSEDDQETIRLQAQDAKQELLDVDLAALGLKETFAAGLKKKLRRIYCSDLSLVELQMSEIESFLMTHSDTQEIGTYLRSKWHGLAELKRLLQIKSSLESKFADGTDACYALKKTYDLLITKYGKNIVDQYYHALKYPTRYRIDLSLVDDSVLLTEQLVSITATESFLKNNLFSILKNIESLENLQREIDEWKRVLDL